MELYRHQVGGHSRFVKPRDSPKVLKPFSQTEYEFYERLINLGTTSTDSGPLHILKHYVPEYYGVTEIRLKCASPLIRKREAVSKSSTVKQLHYGTPQNVENAEDRTHVYPTSNDLVFQPDQITPNSLFFSRRRFCNSASCLSDYKEDADTEGQILSDQAPFDRSHLYHEKLDSIKDDHPFDLEQLSKNSLNLSNRKEPCILEQSYIAQNKLEDNSSASDSELKILSESDHSRIQYDLCCEQSSNSINDFAENSNDASFGSSPYSWKQILDVKREKSCHIPNYVAVKFNNVDRMFHSALDSHDGVALMDDDLVPENTDTKQNIKSNTIVLKYIILQDLVYMYKKPCVVDLKMGRRQRKIGASVEKEKSQLEKSLKTTSHCMGFRLCGFQSYNRKLDVICYRDKYWGRGLTRENLYDSIKKWFWDGVYFYSELLNPLIHSLQLLYTTISELKHYRFWSSSLLWVYDAGSLDAKSRVQSLDVKMIDFANTIILKDNGSTDEDYLFGLKNLIEILEKLSETTAIGNTSYEDYDEDTAPSLPPVTHENDVEKCSDS